MCEIKWLHISDLHQTIGGDDWLWPEFEKAFHEDLARLVDRGGPWDLVFFTGDHVRVGDAREYEKLDEALDRLWNCFAKVTGQAPLLVPVPGNHDLQRPSPKPSLPATLRDDFWTDPAHPIRVVISRAFENYSNWVRKHVSTGRMPADLVPGLLPGDFSGTFRKKDTKIGLVGLNTAALQLASGNYKGKLALHPRQLMAVCGGENFVRWFEDDHDASLLLTHHPPSWLNSAGRKAYEVVARPGRFLAHLFGHRHEAEAVSVRTGGGSGRLSVQAPSLFGLRTYGSARLRRMHGFLFGSLQLRPESTSLRLFPRRLSMQGVLVPDHDSFFLTPDHGTDNLIFLSSLTARPETLAGRTPMAATRRTATTATVPRDSTDPHDYVHPAIGDRFFGREGEIRRFVAALRKGRSVAVYGLQRIGKTSLVKEVLEVLLPRAKENPVVFEIDMFRSADTLGTYFDFSETLFHQLRENVAAPVREVHEEVRAYLRANPETRVQQDGIRRLFRLLAKTSRRVVLFIDEFQEIERAFALARARTTRTDPIDSGFVRFLSSLVKDSTMKLQLVISGRYRLVELDREHKFELLKLMEPIHLTHLDDRPAKALVTEPTKAWLSFEPKAVDRILALTGGNAYLINILCSELCDQATAEKVHSITLSRVEDLVDAIAADPIYEANLGVLYEDFDELADGCPMDALLALAAGAVENGIGQGRPEITECLIQRGVSETEAGDTARRGLRELEQARLVEQDPAGRYVIVPDIIRVWLRRRHVSAWMPGNRRSRK